MMELLLHNILWRAQILCKQSLISDQNCTEDGFDGGGKKRRHARGVSRTSRAPELHNPPLPPPSLT